MFKKLLFKSVVGAAVAGSALTVSLVATPAVVASAPEIQNVACKVRYPGNVSTSTKVALSRSMAIYGQSATATATVSSGTRTPVGQVRFTLSRSNGTRIAGWTVSLRSGQASVTLPRLAARNTYTVAARYLAPSCSVFSTSSGRAYYIVNPAGTTTRVSAPDVWTLNAAKATAVVSSPSPVSASGSVRFTLTRSGRQIASRTVSLSGERASVSFGKLRPGSYSVKASYLGNRNFLQSSDSDAIRVTS